MGIFQQSFGFNGAGGIGPGYNAFDAESYTNPNQGPLFNPSFPNPGDRQQFQQQRRSNPYATNPNDPSVAGSIAGLVGSPFGVDNSSLGHDPFQSRNAFVRGVTNRPEDHAMNFTQQWGIPFAAMMGANRFSRIRVDRRNARAGRMASGFSRFGSSFTGKSEAETARLAERARNTQGIFEAAGNSLGRGATRGFFGAARRVGLGGMFGESGTAAAFESGAADTIGAATGVAGGLALPFAAAEVGVGVANHAVFNKYTDLRRGSMALRHDYSHRYFGRNQGGNVLTGYGLSHRESARQATQIEQSGISDFTLSGKQYQEIGDLGAKSGMLENLGGSSGQISQKVKSLAQEVKVVMEVANLPDVKDAIKSLTKLKNMGASSAGGSASQISNIARGLSQAAGASGTSMGQVFQASSQASEQYRQAGMAPAMGMMAAANTYEGFKSAYQVGAISPEMRAIMGGASGFTNTMSGFASNMLSSNQGRMIAFDRAHGGSDNTFGQMAQGAYLSGLPRHPLQTQGEATLNQGKNAAALLKAGNFSAVGTILKPDFDAWKRYHPGQKHLSIAQKVAAAQDFGGLTSDQAQAYGHGIEAMANPRAYRHRSQAEGATARNNQYKINYGAGLELGNNWAGKSDVAVREGIRNVEHATTGILGGLQQAVGGAQDEISKLVLPGQGDNRNVINFAGSRKKVQADANQLAQHTGSLSELRKYIQGSGKSVFKRFSTASGRTYDPSSNKDLEQLINRVQDAVGTGKEFDVPGSDGFRVSDRERKNLKGQAGIIGELTPDLIHGVNTGLSNLKDYFSSPSGSLSRFTPNPVYDIGKVLSGAEHGSQMDQLKRHLNTVLQDAGKGDYSAATEKYARQIMSAKSPDEIGSALGKLRYTDFSKKFNIDQKFLGARSTAQALSKASTHQSGAGNSQVHYLSDQLHKVSKDTDAYLKSRNIHLHQDETSKNGIEGVYRLREARKVLQSWDGGNNPNFWKSNVVRNMADTLGLHPNKSSADQKKFLSVVKGMEINSMNKGEQSYSLLNINEGDASRYGTHKAATKKVSQQIEAMNAAGITFGKTPAGQTPANGNGIPTTTPIESVSTKVDTSVSSAKKQLDSLHQNIQARNSSQHDQHMAQSLSEGFKSLSDSSNTISTAATTLNNAAKSIHKTFDQAHKDQQKQHNSNGGWFSELWNGPASLRNK